MTHRDTITNTATALRLARTPEGVTVTQLADACGIHRTNAHAILAKLEAAGVLTREGGIGRHGHVYRMVTGQ